VSFFLIQRTYETPRIYIYGQEEREKQIRQELLEKLLEEVYEDLIDLDRRERFRE
jgi:hypothetical protein